MLSKTIKLDLGNFSKTSLDSQFPKRRKIRYLRINHNTYRSFLLFLGPELDLICLPQKYRRGRVAHYRGAKLQIENNLSDGEINFIV